LFFCASGLPKRASGRFIVSTSALARPLCVGDVAE
jgi:hypothetical protein